MARESFRVKKALNIEPNTTTTSDEKGDLKVTPAGLLNVHDGSSYNEVVDTDTAQVLSNKTFSDSVAVGQSGAPDASSVLELESTTKGFLPPRMTEAERDAISSPAESLIIYNTDTSLLNIYDGATWGALTGGGGIVDLTADVTGVLPEANGGTNQSTYTTGDTLYASATDTLSKLAIGSDGDVLSVASGVPAWVAPSGNSPNEVISSGSGNFSTTSGSYVDVTNLSITITTTGQRIIAVLQPLDGTANDSNIDLSRAAATASGYFKLVRDSTDVSSVNTRYFDSVTTSAHGVYSPSAVAFTEKPAAGSYTYKVQAKTDNSASLGVNNCVLLVYELNTPIAIIAPTTSPNSSVFLDTGLGHGSGGTAIRTFTNATTVGADLTYTASTTNGDKVTVNTSGVYSLGWYDRNSGGAYNFGFTKNQSTLTDDVSTVSSSERIFYGINSTTVGDQVYATTYLNANDVIRFNDGGSSNNSAALVQAFITRVS